MSGTPFGSIVVNNYNYGRYLREAINSALGQTHDRTEVIVVDDGSVDDSRDIIAGYGAAIVPVFKANGGQASALNAGFAESRGDVVIFLDADDVLEPTALERTIGLLADPEVVKVHWPLWVIDEFGVRSGRIWPSAELPRGDLRERAIREGPSSSGSPPTSGNAWTRSFLERVLPISNEYTLCADDYLYALAPAFGPIERVLEPQGCYRIHGKNNYLSRPFAERLCFGHQVQSHQCAVLSDYLRRSGVEHDPGGWTRHLWFHRLDRAMRAITAHVPPSGAFILVDEDQWGTDDTFELRRRLRFPERDGHYWGPPANDADAISELERLRGVGAGFLVFAWPAYWWRDYYRVFHRHLLATSRCVHRDDDVTIFNLARQ